jgi:predicted DsbA family dithiol-disulfide isomerase
MQVEIWSDILCPWCAVGRARFETALEGFADKDAVELRWRSFELNPNAPKAVEGDYVLRLAEKYGRSRDQAQQMIDQMTETAAQEGLDFNFDIVQAGNSFDAHRLLHLAAERGCQDALKRRLFEAYLSEGALISDHPTLQRLAVEVGLGAEDVAEVLASDTYAAEVRADERQASEHGIRGVPFFVIDGQYGLSGAQPAAVIAQTLEKARLAQAVAPAAAPGCDADGCAI